jgi:hypothetical protein
MSNQLLEQYVRIQTAVTEYVAELRERMREQAGQTTVEWLVIMVGLTALALALVGAGVWTSVAQGIAKAVGDLITKTVGHAV